MTMIRQIIEVAAPASEVWDVIRDVGAVHTRFAPGFVLDTKLEAGERIVTFANGHVLRERIIALDDEVQRLAYSVLSEQLEHHNASFEVVSLSPVRTQLVWTADILPNSAAEFVRPMMEEGSKVISTTLAKLA